MKMVEYQHRNEGGGNMVQLPNEVFGHGELVMVVSKQELLTFVEKANLIITKMLPGVKKIAFEPIRELNELCIELAALQRKLRK